MPDLCSQGVRATANEGGGQQIGLAVAIAATGALLQTREFFSRIIYERRLRSEFQACRPLLEFIASSFFPGFRNSRARAKCAFRDLADYSRLKEAVDSKEALQCFY